MSLPTPDNPWTSGSALRTSGLHKEFRLQKHVVPVLNGIDLDVQDGEWLALVGASGSGKTTLLHLLGALDKPTRGTVECRGQNYAVLSRQRKASLRYEQLGLVFQAYHLFPELNALENVLLPALRPGRNKTHCRTRAAELLDSFGLGHRLNHRPLELSGGEQQRVAVARALINDPSIILADEPTGNLDSDASSHIIDIFVNLHREQRKTIVVVTHDMSIAEAADRRIRLVDGHASEMP